MTQSRNAPILRPVATMPDGEHSDEDAAVLRARQAMSIARA